MPQLKSFVRVAFGSGLLLALGSACGGQSFSGGGDGGDAGSAQGGTSSTAGTTGTAGKGHAGHATGGSSSAGTGNVGGTSSGGTSSGGTSSAGTGTIGGTGVGGAPDYGACNLPSDCTIRGTGCCGVCDSPMLTTADFVAFNRMYANLFQCGIALDAIPAGGTGSAGASAPIACAPCLQPPPGQGTLMYFVPNCVKGQCVVEDLRTSAVTACKASDECKVRHGTGCCEGCGSGDQIAVRNDGSFEKLVCSSGPVACPACAPLPTGAIPVCDTSTGHCAIAYPATAGTDPTP